MYLMQILLPIRDRHNQAFPQSHYQRVRDVLIQQFHGLTTYTWVPAEGFWKDDDQTIQRDDIVIFEVMIEKFDEQFDTAWWAAYKEVLSELFQQREIIIRLQVIRLL